MLLYYEVKQIWKDLARAVSEEISGLERCIKQLVLNVAKNVKFHSNLPKASQFIAKNAIETKNQAGFNSKYLKKAIITFLLIWGIGNLLNRGK